MTILVAKTFPRLFNRLSKIHILKFLLYLPMQAPKMLDPITPIILAYNEEPNLQRTLQRLRNRPKNA